MISTVVILCIVQSALSYNPPKFVQLGFIAPKFTKDGVPHIEGRQAVAATMMAVKQINNKTDGILDDLLPNTKILIAFKSPRQSFLEAVAAALYLSGKAFNGTGILGLIGTSATDSSKATAEVFSNTPYKIPQIAYGAESSDLGHSLYSHFSRVCPSDAYEGRIIARLVKKYFGWATVTLFASGDTFGNDITLEFETEAALLGGINIESRYTFWSGITDFTDIIQNAKDKGGVLKIFLLFMKSQDSGILMEQGHKMGLFKKGTQIIGTEYLMSTETILAMSADADVGAIMKGAISITTTLANKKKELIFKSFVKRFRSQKNTMRTRTDGSIACDQSKDDDNKEYLYMGHSDGLDDQSSLVCTGLNFKSFATDGSDISKEAMFAYDATFAMAHALHSIYYIQQTKNITGDILLNTLVYNVTFNGLSGPIHFNTGGPGFEQYGMGDRLGGNDFVVYNFDPRSYHALVDYGAGAWFETGIYTYKNKFETCNMKTDSRCSQWVFNTIDNSPPIDEAPVEEVQMDVGTRTGLQVGAAVVLTMVVIYAIVIKLCEDTKLVKASQPTMMKIVLLGAVLACIRVFIATLDLNDSICIAGKWLGHLSFAFVFGALVMKIWRVDVVVNSGFRKVRVTSRQVEHMILGCLLLFCTYLLADTLYSQPHMSYDESFDGHTNIRLMKCTNKSSTMTETLYVIEAALLIAGARLCWSTKDVPDAINDSRYIAMSMYLIVFVCSVTFPIVYFQIQPTPALLLMVMAVGFIVATVGCITMLFGPKSKLLWDGADVDENFAIVRQNSKTNTSNNLIKWKKKISSSVHSSETKRTVNKKESDVKDSALTSNTNPIQKDISEIQSLSTSTNAININANTLKSKHTHTHAPNVEIIREGSDEGCVDINNEIEIPMAANSSSSTTPSKQKTMKFERENLYASKNSRNSNENKNNDDDDRRPAPIIKNLSSYISESIKVIEREKGNHSSENESDNGNGNGNEEGSSK